MDHQSCCRFRLQVSSLEGQWYLNHQLIHTKWIHTNWHRQHAASHTFWSTFFSNEANRQVWLLYPHSPHSHQTLHEVRSTSAFCGELPQQPSPGGTSPVNFKSWCQHLPQKNQSESGGFSVVSFLKEKACAQKIPILPMATRVSGGRISFFDIPTLEHGTEMLNPCMPRIPCFTNILFLIFEGFHVKKCSVYQTQRLKHMWIWVTRPSRLWVECLSSTDPATVGMHYKLPGAP